MTKTPSELIWRNPFSPEEIAKTKTEAENMPVDGDIKVLRNRAFSNLPGLLHAAEKQPKERN